MSGRRMYKQCSSIVTTTLRCRSGSSSSSSSSSQVRLLPGVDFVAMAQSYSSRGALAPIATPTSSTTNITSMVGGIRQQVPLRRLFHETVPQRVKQRNPSSRQRQQLQQQHPQQTSTTISTVGPIALVAFFFASWFVSDWVLEDKQRQKNEDLRKQLLRQLQKQQPEWLLQNDGNDDNNDDDDPPLFYCVIRRVHGWNVTHCLTGAKVGDVVEVFQERTGPQGDYNLCRLVAQKGTENSVRSVGLFPIRWLQRLDNYQGMVVEQQNNAAAQNDK